MKLARGILGAVVICAPVAMHGFQTREAVPTATPAEVSFQFERVGLPVPRFVLRVREDGTGRYQAEQVASSSKSGAIQDETAQHVDRTLVVGPTMTAKIFAAARAADHFHSTCASKAKNIANTGTKTLSYTASDGNGTCVYNYTESKPIVQLTEIFLGLVNTLDEGRKLEFLERYDRLGLDAEMTFLSQEAAAGNALELPMISSTLASIANNPDLIERVRPRAASMIEQARNAP